MRLIEAAELERLLPDAALIGALHAMFRAGCELPLRHHHSIETTGTAGTLLLMPAWRKDGHLGIKLVTVFPDNGERGLPAVIGQYLLLSARTGQPLALLDGTMLTRRRTAAASALAAQLLARPDASRLLMMGTGALAPHLIAAHAAARPIREVAIWGRNAAKAQALAARLNHGDLAGLKLRAFVADDLERNLAAADIVSCATLARAPILPGAWLKRGQHVDLVGGFTPAMRETDDAAIARARVYVDTRQGAIKEAGDIVQPLANGTLAEQGVIADLFDLCRAADLNADPYKIPAGRGNAADITLFKSVGTALEDLAAAELAVAPPRGS